MSRSNYKVAQEQAQADRDERAELKAAAEAESTIYAQYPASPLIAEVILKNNTIIVRYPHADPAFNGPLKDIKYRWNGESWTKTVGVNPDHRLAEVLATILAAHFNVRCANPEARRMAVDGTFRPENLRKLLLITKSPRTGDFALTWPYEDHLYDALKRIKGVRWDSDHQRAICPAAMFNEIEDFALSNGFAIGDGARTRIDEMRAASRDIKRLTVKRAQRKPPRDAGVGIAPNAAVVPDQVTIPAALRDEDAPCAS